MSLGISKKLCSPHLPLAAQFETCSSLIAAAGKGEVHMGFSVFQARSEHVMLTQHCSFFDVGHTLGISELWSATSVPGIWLGLAVWSRRFSAQTRTYEGPSPHFSSWKFLILYPIHGISQMSQEPQELCPWKHPGTMSLTLVPGGQSGAADYSCLPAGSDFYRITPDQPAGMVMACSCVVILTHIGQKCVLSYHLFPPPSLGLKHVWAFMPALCSVHDAISSV